MIGRAVIDRGAMRGHAQEAVLVRAFTRDVHALHGNQTNHRTVLAITREIVFCKANEFAFNARMSFILTLQNSINIAFPR